MKYRVVQRCPKYQESRIQVPGTGDESPDNIRTDTKVSRCERSLEKGG